MSRRALALAPFALLAATTVAHADRRVFTHPFQYGTEAPGDTSVTLWHTEGRPAWDGSTAALDFRLQLQQGLTEHWDAAVYMAFAQTASSDAAVERSFGLDEVRLQNRYRFADRSEWPVDVQLQLDVARQFGPSIYDIDLRAVVARDLDKLTLAANIVALTTLGNDVARAFDVGWAAGAGYEAHPLVTLGVEAFGQVDAKHAAVGPVIAVAPTSRVWLAASGVVGLTDETDDLIVRVLLGLEL